MSFQAGDTVGDYKVIDEIGAGGSGRVFRVEHAITGRVEAMKVLLSGQPDAQEQAQRFLREIKVQANLSHPNIAGVHNALWVQDSLVMIMELVEGESLESKLRAGPLPLHQAVDYVAQALAALSYAHARGVIHRDIKPANMIVRPDGTLKLTDFGLARTRTDPRLTQTGAVLGSLYYMSPEQVKGDVAIDERTDIYSLGAVFYELATGKKPFDFDQPFALMSAHVQQQPLPTAEWNAALPQALNDAVLKAMAKDPAGRFSSADEFREAIGVPAESANDLKTRNQPAPAQRSTGSGRRDGEERQIEGPAAASAALSPKQQLLSSPARAESAPGQSAGGLRRLQGWQLAAGLVLLAVVVSLVGLPSSSQPVTEPEAEPETPKISLAVPSGEFELLRRLGAEESCKLVSLSPDNQHLASVSSAHLVTVWEAATGRKTATLEGHKAEVNAAAFSPDGSLLATASSDHTVKLWDLSKGEERATLQHGGPVTLVVFSPDSAWLASASADKTVNLWDAATAKMIRSLPVEAAAVAIAPNSELLACASPQGEIRLWKRKEGEGRLLGGYPGSVTALAFNADGGRLVAAGDYGVRAWDLKAFRETQATAAVRELQAAAFTPRGSLLGLKATAETVSLWDIAAAAEVGAFYHNVEVRAAALSFDGLHVVTATDAGDLWVWRARPAYAAAQARPPAVRQRARAETPAEPAAHAATAANPASDGAQAPAARDDAAPLDETAEGAAPEQNEKKRKKKGVFRRFIGIFR